MPYRGSFILIGISHGCHILNPSFTRNTLIRTMIIVIVKCCLPFSLTEKTDTINAASEISNPNTENAPGTKLGARANDANAMASRPAAILILTSLPLALAADGRAANRIPCCTRCWALCDTDHQRSRVQVWFLSRWRACHEARKPMPAAARSKPLRSNPLIILISARRLARSKAGEAQRQPEKQAGTGPTLRADDSFMMSTSL